MTHPPSTRRRVTATGPVFATAMLLNGALAVVFHAVALRALNDNEYATVAVVSAWQAVAGVSLTSLVVAIAASGVGSPLTLTAKLCAAVAAVTAVICAGVVAVGHSPLVAAAVGVWAVAAAAGVPARGVLVAREQLAVVAGVAVGTSLLRIAFVVAAAPHGLVAVVFCAAAAETISSTVLLAATARTTGQLNVGLVAATSAVAAQLGLWVALAAAAQVAATSYEPATAAAVVAGFSILSGLVSLAVGRSQGAVPRFGAGAHDSGVAQRSLTLSSVALAAVGCVGVVVAWPIVDTIFDGVFPSPLWVVGPVAASAVWAALAAPLTATVTTRHPASFAVWLCAPGVVAAVELTAAPAVWVAVTAAAAVALVPLQRAADTWHRGALGATA